MHEKILSKKDVIKGWAKYFLCAEVSSGFERLTAPAFCFGMDPVLNKLYHDSPEEYKEALKRHLMFYNSEASWGSMIYGRAYNSTYNIAYISNLHNNRHKNISINICFL